MEDRHLDQPNDHTFFISVKTEEFTICRYSHGGTMLGRTELVVITDGIGRKIGRKIGG